MNHDWRELQGRTEAHLEHRSRDQIRRAPAGRSIHDARHAQRSSPFAIDWDAVGLCQRIAIGAATRSRTLLASVGGLTMVWDERWL